MSSSPQAQLGQYNTLQVIREKEFGVFVDGGELGSILVPKRYVPDGCQVGNQLKVFLYLDSEDDIIATTETSKACVGECAYLTIKDVNAVGAFADWGLSKDLLIPFSEQSAALAAGKAYVVYVYIDSSNRICGSTKLSRHLQEESVYFKAMQPVALMVCGRSELGYKMVIDGSHLGLLFRDDVLQPLKLGEKLQGFIKDIRPDGKINVCLQKQGQAVRDELSEKILAHMQANGGQSNYNDKSAPDAIYNAFQVSKKNFKQALGKLLKEKKITIDGPNVQLK